MEKVEPAVGGFGPAAETKKEPVQTETKLEETVQQGYSREFVEKVLNEKKNAMESLRQMQSEVKRRDEEKLLADKKYEELAETRLSEINDWKTKYETSQKTIQNSMKTSVLKKELTKLGCHPEYIDKAVRFADLNEINYDTETGVVSGADNIAKSISEELKPFFGNQAVGTNQSAPVGTPKTMSIEDWKRLPYEERQKHKAAVYASHGITLRQ